MKIKKVKLKNGYKRFHDLTIDLGENPARLVVLIGPNGSGKSSVLDGILYHHQAYRTVGNTGSRDYRYHSKDQSSAYSYRNIEIHFESGTYDQIHQLRSDSGTASTMFALRSPYRYNTELRVDSVSAVDPIANNNYGASLTLDLDSKIEQSYRRLNIAYNKYLEENDCPPSQARAKIIGDLNDSIQRCLNLSLFNLGDIAASKGTLFFQKPDHETPIDFNFLSSGEKEVIDLLLDLYLRKEDYSETIFLIDEPELHINTSIQRKLLVEIDRLVGKDCQIWITTHSIGFMSAIQEHFRSDCQVIHFPGEYEFASKPYALEPIPLTSTTWRELFEIALDDLAHLVCPKQIVYCEGTWKPRSDGSEQGLDATVFNTIFGESHPETLFVSSGGNTEPDQRSRIAITILGKAVSGLEILVLKDRDMASGKPTTEEDRQEYLKNNPANHRVLKRFEIENYLYDKEVLRSYCAERQHAFDEGAYDAAMGDMVNDDVKSKTGYVKNFCGIVGSISADKFKENLAKHVRPGSLEAIS